MSDADPLRSFAERLADLFAEAGYAFVEDDKLDDLTSALRLFLDTEGLDTEGLARPVPACRDRSSVAWDPGRS